MRLWFLSHRRPAKAQVSMHIRAVSPAFAVCTHEVWKLTKGSTSNQTSSPTGWMRMRVWRMHLRRTKNAIISCFVFCISSTSLYNAEIPKHRFQSKCVNYFVFGNHISWWYHISNRMYILLLGVNAYCMMHMLTYFTLCHKTETVFRLIKMLRLYSKTDTFSVAVKYIGPSLNAYDFKLLNCAELVSQ